MAQTTHDPFPRPTSADRKEWRNYWEHCGQPWRTEPEISIVRQQKLAGWRKVPANVEKGIYPFRKRRLLRPDVEWLLAGHEEGRGPVLTSEAKERVGLDLRGADLSGVNLAGLPLTGLIGGLDTPPEGQDAYEARQAAAIHLEGASLEHAHLEYAHLRGASLKRANLEGAIFDHAYLDEAYLDHANLRNSRFFEASLVSASLEAVRGEKAQFWHTNMKWAQILLAHLERSDLGEANLEEADLSDVHLEGANLDEACLAGASLHKVSFDANTDLQGVDFGDVRRGLTSFSDIRWDTIDLDQIDWSAVPMLGNEYEAGRETSSDGEPKSQEEQLEQYREAAKVTRYLARALYAQGLDEESAYFALRARRIERTIFSL